MGIFDWLLNHAEEHEDDLQFELDGYQLDFSAREPR